MLSAAVLVGDFGSPAVRFCCSWHVQERCILSHLLICWGVRISFWQLSAQSPFPETLGKICYTGAYCSWKREFVSHMVCLSYMYTTLKSMMIRGTEDRLKHYKPSWAWQQWWGHWQSSVGPGQWQSHRHGLCTACSSWWRPHWLSYLRCWQNLMMSSAICLQVTKTSMLDKRQNNHCIIEVSLEYTL